MRPEYRSQIGENYKRKIEAIVRAICIYMFTYAYTCTYTYTRTTWWIAFSDGWIAFSDGWIAFSDGWVAFTFIFTFTGAQAGREVGYRGARDALAV